MNRYCTACRWLIYLIGLVLTWPILAQAEIVLQPLNAPAKRGPNLIANPGFEQLEANLPAGWKSQLGPAQIDTASPHQGKACIRFTKPETSGGFWLTRTVEINQKRPLPLVISGWSKAEQVAGKRGDSYSLWVDLQYVDGTSLYGQKAVFDVGTHDWQYVEFPFVVAKPVKRASVSILFRGSVTGTVWFDDVALQEMELSGCSIFEGKPMALHVNPQAAPTTPAAQVATSDGLTLGFGSQGQVAELIAGGHSILGRAPGGFWLRDVAAAGPWRRALGKIRQDGKNVTFESDETSGLRLNAHIESRPDRIDVTATLADTTSADRAVSLCFVLPLTPEKRTWHDDIVRSTPTVPQAEYRNAQSWPATGLSSAYPFSSLTSQEAGLSLAVPMDCPRVCRFVYNTWMDVFFVAYDLGLVKDTLNFPSRAEVRFSLYRHAPEWGFRAAAQGYYDRFPQFFQQRLKRGGIWMAFDNIGKIENFEDFGFAYDELGGNHRTFDDQHGIASFDYVEPMTYWLPMAKKYPRTYEGALAALADNEASGKPSLVRWAQVTRRCAAFTEAGRFDLALENQAWCDGAVFTLNPDPRIPEDAACPVNKGHMGYQESWADKHLKQSSHASLHGIYIDSMPNWGNVRNWRREHWRTVEAPLTFDPDTKKPVLLQIFSTWQFTKWVADHVHAHGGVMHGNGGTLWPYFPALIDVTGQETHSLLSDDVMARARTLLRNKPYSPLLNTHFDAMGAALVEDYFHRSLLYDIFPSFFNGDYMKDGRWEHVRYFNEPKFYNRDRPLFKKFIPILRRMFDAGWQPITYAHAQPTQVRVERYGPSADGELLWAVYNPSTASLEARLTIDAAALKLNSRQPSATGLVSGAALTCRRNGDQIEVLVPLNAKRCEVVRLAQ